MLAAQGALPPAPLAAPLVWWCLWRTGAPAQTASSAIAVAVGTPAQAARSEVTFTSPYGSSDILSLATPAIPASPVCSRLLLRRGSGGAQADLTIYANGLAHRKDL